MPSGPPKAPSSSGRLLQPDRPISAKGFFHELHVTGSVVCFEIGTTDPQSTIDFYSKAFGWRFEKDETAGGKPYFSIFTGGDRPAGGLWDHSSSTGGGDYMLPSILVTDVPATAAAATDAGARVEHGPESNPDGLVFARLCDPHGNRFGLFSMPNRNS